jgi:hypothetical protein
MLKAWTNSV